MSDDSMYSDEVKRRMARNKAKFARDDAERELQQKPPLKGRVEPLSRIGYAKGYEYAEALVKGKLQAQEEAFRHSKVMRAISAMPKRKKPSGGIENKALVPKRGMKAGPLTD